MSIPHLTPTFSDIKTWVRSAVVSVNLLIKSLANYLPLTGGTLTGDLSVPDEAYGAGWNASLEVPTKNALYDKIETISAGGVSDGDKGDITVSGTGTVWTVDNDAITYAKIQNVSATDKLLGRSTAGAGDIEEIACTAAGRALLDDANAAAQQATLSLVPGTNVQAWDADLDAISALSGTNTIYYRSAANTWTAVTISNDLLFSGGTLGRNKGTSFPGSPASGDRFTRTDRNIDYFYDGSQWLSTQLHTIIFESQESGNLTPTTNSSSRYGTNPWWNAYDIYVLTGEVRSRNSATTAANYFVNQFKTHNNGSIANFGSSMSGQSLTQNQMIGQSVTINSTVSSAVEAFELRSDETGTASSIITGVLTYRLIG